jgi:mitochondrial fission protein ELM1
MSNELANRNEELYVVEVDGIKKSQHRVFIEALKCGMELKRSYPSSEVKLRDAGATAQGSNAA